MRKVILAVFIAVWSLNTHAQSINGYKYAIVSHASNGGGWVEPVVVQNVARIGFMIVPNANAVPEEEWSRTCMIGWNQYGNLTQYCELYVRDGLTGKLIVHTKESCRMRVGVPACVRGSIEKACDALKYHGYNEADAKMNVALLFEARPKMAKTESEIRAMSFDDPIEGIWTESANRYTIAIIPDAEKKYGD